MMRRSALGLALALLFPLGVSWGCGDDSGTGPGPVCGNGAVEGQEECDGEDLGGESCESLGLVGGTLACTEDCTFDVSGCEQQAECGNGVREYPEECDGTDLAGRSCQDLGFQGGSLACRSDCTYDTSRCEGGGECGNGTVEGDEECDGEDLAGESCESLGLEGGELACTGECTFDVSGCEHQAECGNGLVEYPEECDASDLAGQTCEALGFYGGELSCAGDCTLDVSGCQGTCGDGRVDEGFEECDGDDLAGQTCDSLGYGGGTLRCRSDCTLDVTQCEGPGPVCGDGILEGLEECDGSDLGGQTCDSLGYHDGDLRCAADCTLDVSGCGGQCGDGVLQSAFEECDGTDFGGETCENRGYYTGDLVCTADCTIDDSACSGTCGDGVLQPSFEECDGTDFGNDSCQDHGFAGGELACNADCTVNTDGCFNVETDCGNGVDDDGDGLTDCEDGDCDNAAQCQGVCVPDGGQLDCGDHVAGDLTSDGHDRVESWCGISGYGGPEVVYTGQNTSLEDGVVDVRLWNNTEDLDVFVLADEGTGCSGQLQCVDQSVNSDQAMEKIQFVAEAGQSYFLVVDGWNGATGSYELAVNCLQEETRAVYEQFRGNSRPFDLEGVELEFHPDPQAVGGYTWDATDGLTNLLFGPGNGDVSSETITTFDQPYVQVDLSGSVSFYGQSYSRFYVNVNGYITFVAPDDLDRASAQDLFEGPPRVAGHWLSLVMTRSSSVVVDEYSDGTVVVSYLNMADRFSSATNTFQIVFWPSGDVGIITLQGSRYGLVGLSEGFGLSGPGPVDLYREGIQPVQVPGYYEFFEGLVDTFDLENTSIVFTEDPNRVEGYDVVVSQNGGSCPVTPGDGVMSRQVAFSGSDSFVRVGLNGSIRFFGNDYATIFIGSNGYITFDRGDSTDAPSVQAHFAAARVSGLFMDLDPTQGLVVLDELWRLNVYQVAVSFVDVPVESSIGPLQLVNFQMILSSDGSVVLCYLRGREPSVVGISAGEAGWPPPETDFSGL